MPKFAVILPAAGRSSRFKDKNYKKPYAPLANRAVWLHSAERFINRPDVVQTILVISADDRDYFNFKFSSNVAILGIEVVLGGTERADSVEAALARVKPEAEYVCIHDAVRPCLTDEWVDRIFEAGVKTGAALFAIPIAGTIKRVGSDNTITETVPRQGLWEAQTPQVFRRDWILEAYARRQGFQPTDEAQMLERIGRKVTVVPGSPLNLKIATKEDLRLAEQTLKALPKPRLDGPLHPFAGDDLWR